MAVAPLPSGTSTSTSAGPNTAQAGPRVAPVSSAAPVAQGAGQAPTQSSQQATAHQVSAQQAANAVKQVTTQALLTLMQSLGKPLPGTSMGTAPQGSAGSTPALNVQVQLPGTGAAAGTGGGTGGGNGQALLASLSLPKGAPAPAPGTPLLLSAETTAHGPRITVSVAGTAAPTAQTLRADAARQGSLAPLIADLAKVAGQPGASKGVDAAIGKLMGFTLNGEVTGQSLRNGVDGARSLPQAATLMASTLPSSGAQPGVQNALSALIRALGLSLPHAQTLPGKGGAQPQTAAPTGQGSADKPAAPNLPADARQPTKALAQPLPADAPDLADPAQLQALRSKAEAALSRLNLLQSRMQEGGAQAARGEGPPAVRWDVPLMIGQEAALLGVAIERDGSGHDREQGRHLHWRFRFAFQSTRHGEVEGMVALHQGAGDAGSDVDVAVWAQKPAVIAKLEATRANLVSTLEGLGINMVSLTVAPIEKAPQLEAKATDSSRHLVDLRS